MSPLQIGLLITWLVSNMISFSIMGAGMRADVNRCPAGEFVDGDGYFIMALFCIFLGPLMAAFLIGFTFVGKK